MNDLISRQAAIDAFDGTKVNEEDCTEYDIGYNDGIDFAVSKLSVLPSAEPKKGKWISFGEYKMGRYAGWICSNCETFFDDSKANLYIRCPKCGAYMEE